MSLACGRVFCGIPDDSAALSRSLTVYCPDGVAPCPTASGEPCRPLGFFSPFANALRDDSDGALEAASQPADAGWETRYRGALHSSLQAQPACSLPTRPALARRSSTAEEVNSDLVLMLRRATTPQRVERRRVGQRFRRAMTQEGMSRAGTPDSASENAV